MATGRVKWFNDEMGHGFITSSTGVDVFVHFSSLRVGEYPSLEEGQSVDFDVVKAVHGPAAENVRLAGQPPFDPTVFIGPSRSSGVKAFTGKTARQVEFEVNAWLEEFQAVPISVSIARSHDGDVSAMIVFRVV